MGFSAAHGGTMIASRRFASVGAGTLPEKPINDNQHQTPSASARLTKRLFVDYPADLTFHCLIEDGT